MRRATVEPDRNVSVTGIEIRVGQNRYEALVGSGLLDQAGSLIAKRIAPSRCAIVTDTNIGLLFSERLQKSLIAAGFEPALISIPPGEASKTLGQAGSICDEMIAARLDRRSFVVGLGGGVIGDISGFVAAIFERGVPHVQIPTTLLAMVDSSIGGKTGVNSPLGKNLIGSVHQPMMIIDDPDVLKDLPRREMNQGFAEIVKHAIIANADMFLDLANSPSLLGIDLVGLIRRNIEIKARIVAGDEFDRRGDRAILNFGHTIGHAIERAGDYRTFLHGEAISIGMVGACNISMKKAGFPRDQRDAVIELLKKFQLPAQLPKGFPLAKILDALPFDKKFENGQVRFVVTPAIGSARLSSEVTMDDIREAVEELCR